jgi:RND family efflux transporter MFP subunit
MATADCPDCSSEVGVVHVSPDLLKGVPPLGPLVQTEQVNNIFIDDTVETIGHITLAENQTAHISPRTEGTITNVFMHLGDEVKVGDPLFELVSVEIGRAAAAYKRATSLVRLAKQELTRGENMKKLKITSDKEVFRLAYELEQAQIELSSAHQELLILGIEESDITSARTFDKLARGISTIKAPVMGKITEKHAVTGEIVSPGTTVAVIANMGKLWVWARVYDSDISLVLGHQKTLISKEAAVTVAAFPSRIFHGKIDYVSPVIDKETRTLSVRISIPNDENKLLPGMFCRIALPLGKHSMLAVPRYSVLSDGETNFVFIPFGKNSFAAKAVITGSVHGEFLPVLSGLSAGDTLVTKGTFLLKSEILKERMGAG